MSNSGGTDEVPDRVVLLFCYVYVFLSVQNKVYQSNAQVVYSANAMKWP
jgi:hypothetical protein